MSAIKVILNATLSSEDGAESVSIRHVVEADPEPGDLPAETRQEIKDEIRAVIVDLASHYLPRLIND